MVADDGTLSEITVQGDDQQVDQMRREIQLSEKGMIYVKGIFERWAEGRAPAPPVPFAKFSTSVTIFFFFLMSCSHPMDGYGWWIKWATGFSIFQLHILYPTFPISVKQILDSLVPGYLIWALLISFSHISWSWMFTSAVKFWRQLRKILPDKEYQTIPNTHKLGGPKGEVSFCFEASDNSNSWL